LSKILAFNIENNYAFYQKSKDLDILTKLIQTIVKKQKKNIFSSYLKSIRTAKISTKNADFETALEFDFESIEINDEDDLDEKIDLCMTVFRTIKQTKSDKTGYIFIDELEVYYDRDDIYKRDLTLIRDLIFTIKEFSEITYVTNKNIKFICAIRSEM